MVEKVIIILTFLLTQSFLFGQTNTDAVIRSKKELRNNKITQYEESVKSLSINQMKLTLTNTEIGAESLDEVSFGAIKWPGGQNAFKSLIWFDGLQLVGKVNGKTELMIRTTGTLTHAVQPGKMFDDGTPALPENPKYRTYKIQRGWETLPFGDRRDEFERDFNQWPVEDGALWIDVDGDGFFSRGVDQPDYVGDEQLFFVANDADTSLKAGALSGKVYSNPFGVEFQVSAFAFQGTGVLGDVVFREITMINKSGKTIEDFIVSWYTFLSIGGMPDDAVGIDTVRNFIYGYNADNFDEDYGESPPALGYVLLELPVVDSFLDDSAFVNGNWIEGKKFIEMNNFNFFRGYAPIAITDPYYDDKYISAYNVETFLNTIEGKTHNGRPLIDPNTGEETLFALAGDPVAETGWYDLKEGWANDTVHSSNSFKEFQLALEPFTFEPFDTQRVVIANIAAQGEDNINSIVKLREKVNAVSKAYYKNFFVTPSPPKPKVHSFTEDQKVTLWWDDNAESYDEFDLFLEDRDLFDTTYTFEGYIIEQYADSLGSDPQVILVNDKTNGVTIIEDNIIVNGVSVTVPVIFGNDRGITRFLKISEDSFTGGPLLSGQEYYFGVRAYAYSQYSDPKYKKSPLDIIKVTPGKQKIDYNSPYQQDENVLNNQIEGDFADAKVTTKIIDPSKILGDRYLVEFNDHPLGLAFDLINETKNDTLVKTEYELNTEVEGKLIHDGYILLIENTGKDSINIIDDQNISAVKNVLEVRNEDGFLERPKDVLGKTSTNGEWLITAGGNDRSVKENLNWTGAVGYNTYEIRFTETGSEYYTTGYSILFFETDDDPKGKGRVPFEIWKISRDGTEEKRMKIKIHDKDLRDSSWTKDQTNQWEMIYAYDPDIEYSEPLPETSGDLTRSQFNFGRMIIEGEIPKSGTVIRLTTFRPILDGDKFEITLEPPSFEDTEAGKENIDEISVFPNPFFAGNNTADQNYVRFIGIPTRATIRIFTLSGQIVRKLEKDDQKKFIDWDLRNESGQIVASGMYIAHVDMPDIGSKILKVAIVPSTEFLDLRSN